MFKSEEQKEKNLKQTEPKGPVGQHQLDQHTHCGSPRRKGKREGGREII